jgi:hypothetical protein
MRRLRVVGVIGVVGVVGVGVVMVAVMAKPVSVVEVAKAEVETAPASTPQLAPVPARPITASTRFDAARKPAPTIKRVTPPSVNRTTWERLALRHLSVEGMSQAQEALDNACLQWQALAAEMVKTPNPSDEEFEQASSIYREAGEAARAHLIRISQGRMTLDEAHAIVGEYQQDCQLKPGEY